MMFVVVHMLREFRNNTKTLIGGGSVHNLKMTKTKTKMKMNKVRCLAYFKYVTNISECACHSW